MKLLCFYGKTVSIAYRNQLCSVTTFVVCALTVVAFVLPYYALSSVKQGELWDQQRLVYEQPKVKFPYAYLFLAAMSEPDERSSSVVTCSSFPSYNSLTEQLHPCSDVRVIPYDLDHDHVLDRLSVEISFNPPDSGSRLAYYTFYFFLEASVTSQCSFVVPTLVSLDKVPAPVPFQSGTIVHRGFLQAQQSTSLQCPFFMRHQKSHFSELYFPNENTTLDGFHPTIISAKILGTNPARYKFHTEQPDWTIDDSGSISIKIDVSIGGADSRETALLYRTSLWWKLCQFWGSYFPLLIVSLWLADKAKRYMFENFYLRAVEVVPWKEKYN